LILELNICLFESWITICACWFLNAIITIKNCHCSSPEKNGHFLGMHFDVDCSV
jgi:hypothetical protein